VDPGGITALSDSTSYMPTFLSGTLVSKLAQKSVMLAILNENTNGLFEKGRLIAGGSNWISWFKAHGLACQERTQPRINCAYKKSSSQFAFTN
jgi:hypothetical protein